MITVRQWRLPAALFVALFLWTGAPLAADAPPTVTVETDAGAAIEFVVELATTPEERALGLMHRDRLDPMAGMLFLYSPARLVTMWMKATRIPLDMLFIDQGGTIVKIRERAIPFSQETISSEMPVVAVLEVNGGTVSKFGIRLGDRVRLPIPAD